MKNRFLFLSGFIFISCNSAKDKTQVLQNRIDTLENKLALSYKPGLGEFMSSIQIHHAKLWFAGANENWQLANFEIGEIKEALEDISVYCADRTEVKQLPMINPAIASLGNAIAAKNLPLFKTGFDLLTTTCNNCHHITNHAFNFIKVPDTPPSSNQDFKMHQ